ncbi:hypothetical protein M3X97_14105 [Clostridium perfringens]|nr:hypothetical protein [Clostridium perfringens]
MNCKECEVDLDSKEIYQCNDCNKSLCIDCYKGLNGLCSRCYLKRIRYLSNIL